MNKMILVLILSAAAILASTAQAVVTQTYNFTGAEQSFTVPAGVIEITVEAYGAQGGNSATGTG